MRGRVPIRALAALAAGDDIAQTIVFDAIAAKDWVRASLDGLPPVAAGRFIVHGQHDRAHVPPNKLGIEIEAALAFGTGHHGTTRGCLLLLDQVLRSKMPRRVLDLGSGTGVLAIAAAKALRRNVLASDIDPRAAIVARENAALNGVGNFVEFDLATGFSAPQFRARAPFDLVLANSGQPAAADGASDGGTSRTRSHGDPVRIAAASDAQRDRHLSHAGTGAHPANPDRRMVQPADAELRQR